MGQARHVLQWRAPHPCVLYLRRYAGHEIRNEGDSFVVAFHEALDGVKFCMKVGLLGSGR